MKTIDLAPLPSFLERQQLSIRPTAPIDLDTDQAELNDRPAATRAVLSVLVLLVIAVALLALALVVPGKAGR